MEEAAGNKQQLQATTGSTSSIVDELFGPKDAAAGSSAAAGYFSTVFPPPSAVRIIDRSVQGYMHGISIIYAGARVDEPMAYSSVICFFLHSMLVIFFPLLSNARMHVCT